MANRFHAQNKWVENLKVKWIKGKYNAATGEDWYEICQTAKSFWSGDIEDLCGIFPDLSHDAPVLPMATNKPLTWWRIVGYFLMGAVGAALKSKDADVENLKKFPRIRFRNDGIYYIDDKSEYERLMSILRE